MAIKNRIFSDLKETFNWEYWPTYMFYIPLLPHYIYYSLKSWSFSYFTAANPAIKHGGNGTESKFETLKLLPKELIPKSIFVPNNQSLSKVIIDLKEQQLNFPLIIKPNIGYRGLLVKKLNKVSDLAFFLKQYKDIDFIIQEFISYQNECGILYYRYPDKEKGEITSITLKKYLCVSGDGVSNLAKLIREDAQAQRYETIFKEQIIDCLDFKPQKGEIYLLNEIGNHCKGAIFLNGNSHISQKLTETFDKISHQVAGVYFGRFDIKYESFGALEAGKNFKIIELNGVISEPTHIYDAPNSSYVYAIKSIAKHWEYIYKISRINHLKNKVKYVKIVPVVKDLFALQTYNKLIKKLRVN